MKDVAILFSLFLGLLCEVALSNFFYDFLNYYQYHIYSGTVYLVLSVYIFHFYRISRSCITFALFLCALITSILSYLTSIPAIFTLIHSIRAGNLVNWALIYKVIELLAVLRIGKDGIYFAARSIGFFGPNNSIRSGGKFNAKELSR